MDRSETFKVFCERVEAFLGKGVGIDLVLKCMLGLTRLRMVNASDEATKEVYAGFAMAVINGRMLGNHFRYPSSFSLALRTFKAKEGPLFHWFLFGLSFLLRTFEQMTGDLNYYQMIIMRHWSRSRLSHTYWFFKSLSLTCLLLDEVLLLRLELRSPQWREKTSEERSSFLRRKVISIMRCLLDMCMYYQWVPWYNPYKTLQYCCVTASGFLGVYSGWGDVCDSLAASKARRVDSIKAD
ncbi:hypothetical protein, conserved [Trypanosoma brucei gambiense DAL972]|uniref:Uncharacterized protein n=1 Tax=Trypanosoma brucei gambiense (strain MHOM/CI/86/DAL972) TaxID=679716 RepID=D0A3T7_TRYB9|nr:hypothetical protein, conserved [Trypanosoma brucei gambiense DAL972]CBH15931.1 hypothetical protein, conserved [Trypanosoma brucei gambiense DAL972]|eukprot:XP_011778195.1 hypothetical protein, conserved [Trypanosoma brucei gambiense DAL972]